jgi:LuxR family maltose regulon positive regulatory protein
VGCDLALVLLSAPTGSGKTLAVRQWMDADKRPFAWLQLDRGDNDPVTLLQYVARALGHVTPLDPVVTRWLELPEPPVGKVILPTMAAAVSSASPFVLVLDDSHLVHEPRCWSLVSTLIEALPAGSVMAISGRTDPALPLARLRTHGALAECGMERLAFDREELRTMLELHDVEADEAALDALMASTEGWAAGIYLAVLASSRRGVSLADVPVTGDRYDIAQYLTTEVLAELDPDTVRFLTHTSVVWRLCGELCDALTGRDDGAATLDAVDHNNLFLMRLDGGTGWYRYHHLFADLLQAELRRREPRLVPELHRRAARWFERRDRVADAVHHWLAAGEVEAAGDLVAARWMSRYLTGRLMTARRWLEAFTPEQIRADTPLTIAAAWVHALTGENATARGLLANLGRLEADLPAPDGAASIASSVAILRGTLAADGVARMKEDARLAVRLESAGRGGPWHGFARHLLGVAEMVSGREAAAEEAFESAAVENRTLRSGIDLASVGFLSLLAADAGRWADAEDHAAEAARIAASYELADCLPSVPARMARDRLCARAGDDDAVADLEDLFEELDPEFCPWLRVRAALLVAEALIDRREAAAARGWLDRASADVARWTEAPGLTRRLDELESRLRSLAATEPLTPAETRVLGLLATNLTFAEIAARLNVSPNTVGTHVKAIYRKLGAARRSEAVDRAAGIGLLGGRPPIA